MRSNTITEQVHVRETEESSERDLHLLDYLIIVSRRRGLILGFTLAVALISAVIVLLLPSRYTAETVVMPPSQNGSVSSALLSQLGGGSALTSMAGAGLGLKSPGDLYVALVMSRTVEDAVIRRFGLMARYRATRMSDARLAFEKHSTVVLGGKDGLIRISVTDWDPKLAAQIANGYVEEFRNISADLAVTEASQRRMFFQQQLLDANQNLAAAEEALKQSEQKTGVLQVDSQARALIESAAQLRAQIVAKQVQLQGMRTYATDDNPGVITVRQEIAELQAQLDRLGGSGSKPGSDILINKGSIPEAGMEYVRHVRDVKYYETITELIGKQYEMAKLDEAHQGALVQVVDPAVTPDKRSFPKRTSTVLLFALLGFITATLWVLVEDRLQRVDPTSQTFRKMQLLRHYLLRRPFSD